MISMDRQDGVPTHEELVRFPVPGDLFCSMGSSVIGSRLAPRSHLPPRLIPTAAVDCQAAVPKVTGSTPPLADFISGFFIFVVDGRSQLRITRLSPMHPYSFSWGTVLARPAVIPPRARSGVRSDYVKVDKRMLMVRVR